MYYTIVYSRYKSTKTAMTYECTATKVLPDFGFDLDSTSSTIQ